MNLLGLDEIIGNEDIKKQIKISLGAAKLNNKSLPHMLFCGLPGCGKTTISRAVAAVTGAPFIETSPDAVKTAEDLAKIFDKLPADGYDKLGEVIGEINPAVVFIDEAHRLSLRSEEMLGIAMENWQHSFTVGRGRQKKSVTTWVPRFTLICATTMEGRLSKPFRDRFKLSYVFREYSLKEAMLILRLHANNMQLKVSDEALIRIAQRSRGTPRLMVRYLEAVRDIMTFIGRDEIGIDLVEAQFEMMKIDPDGLSESDIIILKTLYSSELPVGIDTLALQTNQDKETISEVNEPYLLRLGLIERSKLGRVITEKGINHLVKYGHIQKPAEEALSRVISTRNI